MSFNDFMNKVRHWDNRTAQWVVRHFYILFFEIILVAVFIGVFMNTIKIIDIGTDIRKNDIVERLLMSQSVNTLLITILLLFNSFWLLYIFSGLLRIRNLLKNIDFSLSRRRDGPRGKDD